MYAHSQAVVEGGRGGGSIKNQLCPVPLKPSGVPYSHPPPTHPPFLCLTSTSSLVSPPPRHKPPLLRKLPVSFKTHADESNASLNKPTAHINRKRSGAHTQIYTYKHRAALRRSVNAHLPPAADVILADVRASPSHHVLPDVPVTVSFQEHKENPHPPAGVSADRSLKTPSNTNL